MLWTSVQWDTGWLFRTYLFTILDPISEFKPGHHLIVIDDPVTGFETIVLVGIVKQIAKSRLKGDVAWWSSEQPEERYGLKMDVPKHETLQYLKALNRLRAHEKTWTELLNVVGSQNVPGLHRIFKNADRLGWSAEKLLQKAREALEGLYDPRSYSDVELDLATTVYELGDAATSTAFKNRNFYSLLA
ncbi:hypothetical protein CVT26_014060 [Gymnopilus dilepis]|uniref:Uncharacterized protein n=1 Tax=Gymnopilus dilepis TaxID=231916 RepID=A0A409VX29_9AGAR|nr:hypothetical protein CVT26_014060 [Gymnopilus dilepis]